MSESPHQPPPQLDAAADRTSDEDRSGAGRSRRSSWVVAGVVVIVTLALLAAAYVPRTVAEGGQGEQTWRLTLTPGIASPTLRLVASDGFEQRAGGFGARPSLDTTQVWAAPPDEVGDPVTIVAGLAPSGTDSVRVTSDARGVGEATVRRVAWRRVHVAEIDAEAYIEELVAISEDGRVLDAVSDLGPPAPYTEPPMDATGP